MPEYAPRSPVIALHGRLEEVVRDFGDQYVLEGADDIAGTQRFLSGAVRRLGRQRRSPVYPALERQNAARRVPEEIREDRVDDVPIGQGSSKSRWSAEALSSPAKFAATFPASTHSRLEKKP